jgi:hypothetical protein
LASDYNNPQSASNPTKSELNARTQQERKTCHTETRLAKIGGRNEAGSWDTQSRRLQMNEKLVLPGKRKSAAMKTSQNGHKLVPQTRITSTSKNQLGRHRFEQSK